MSDSMKVQILRLLREAPEFISGQQLCEQLHVSRTAIWKVMNQLKEEGYEVEAVRNKGYRLMESPDITTEEELSSQMDTRWAGQELHYFQEIDSTNLEAKRLGEQNTPHGTLVIAEKQTAGRGRRGKGWESPSGSSIYMTILLRPELEPTHAPMLTLVMAVAVAKAIRQETELEAKIKWPNDVVVNGKKVVGILTEMSTEIDYINHVVIGVGINVNTQKFPEEISATATSLALEKGKQMRRSPLIVSVMQQFETYYERFIQSKDLAFLMEEYNHLLVNCNREVKVLGKESHTGIARGINTKGELLVERENGETEVVFAGEVSVRGIYGYV